MSDEPQYIPIDDNGDPYEIMGNMRKPTTPFQEKILGAVGRKLFLNEAQAKEINKWEKKILACKWQPGNRPIPAKFWYIQAWVDNCIDWVIKKNNSSGKPYPIITMPKLFSMVKNADHFHDWVDRVEASVNVEEDRGARPTDNDDTDDWNNYGSE